MATRWQFLATLDLGAGAHLAPIADDLEAVLG
jgi:hypothetical protein